MKSHDLSPDSRSGRIVIGVGVAFVVWLFCALRLSHRCLLGYKWFEHYSPLAVSIISACCIILVRRLWLAALIAAAIGFAFFQFAIPPYLDWIHGPNHPYFPAAEAQRARLIKDLRLIESSSDDAGRPITPQTPPK